MGVQEQRAQQITALVDGPAKVDGADALAVARNLNEGLMPRAILAENGRSNIEQRLARWLLMADDRIDGEELPLTQEFLSIMLGVRRAGVTTAVQELERQGLIATKRGAISLLDREALEECAGGTYSPLDHA
jgi:CRP-like cAMP-binding protein